MANPDVAYTNLEILAPVVKSLHTVPRVRSGTFSASSAGYCLRRQELGYLGMAPTPTSYQDPSLTNIFNDGKWRHLRWQANLLSARILTEVERSYTWPKRRGYGTVDGLGYVPDDHAQISWRGEEFGFELKGVTPFLYPKYVNARFPIDKHMFQVHRYFLLTGVRLFAVVYENKGTNDYHEWVLTPMKLWMERSLAELTELNRAIDDQRLTAPLMMCQARKGSEWDSCPFAGKGGTCESAGTWPRITTVSKEANVRTKIPTQRTGSSSQRTRS